MAKIQIGSIITGTLRNEDLIPAFADELSVMEMSEKGVTLLHEVDKFLGKPDESQPDFDSEDAGFLVGELMDALEEYAPPHMRFGSLEGDGADFRWWPTGFDDCPTTTISEGKNGEGTFVDTECELFVEVNDHGNITVKELGGAVIWDAV